MLFILQSSHSAAPAHTDSTTSTSTRPHAARLIKKLAYFQKRAPRELARYFARARRGDARGASDAVVETILDSISAYHRGVLSLHYSGREWPEAVTEALGEFESIAIRLYCADHPATGTTSSLERAAAECIAAKAAVADTDPEAACMLLTLSSRAARHHEKAIRAYAKAARRYAVDAVSPTHATTPANRDPSRLSALTNEGVNR